jgi:hypothetical protein
MAGVLVMAGIVTADFSTGEDSETMRRVSCKPLGEGKALIRGYEPIVGRNGRATAPLTPRSRPND